MPPELADELFPVAEGASAWVFRTQRDGAEVALKIAKDDASWLGAEAEILGAAARRWGPTLIEHGRTPSGVDGLPAGRPYLATSWVDGQPLDTVAARHDDPKRLALVVAHAVGRGLAELHAAGVRHGDVKPANILVHDSKARPSRDHADDRGATLIDLGLAHAVTGDAATGGTPHYLAPELRDGAAATPASDLYALGVVLEELGAPAAWTRALLSTSPGARPSATWIGDRAARALGLLPDEEEARASRVLRVRRAYLALRRRELRAGATLHPDLVGAPRAWLEDVLALSRSPEGEAGEIAPLDSLGVARWIVALVGLDAASWRLPDVTESVLAERLLALAAVQAPEAWTIDEIAGASAHRESPLPRLHDHLALTRALLEPRPRADVLRLAEDAASRADAPASLVLDLGAALLRRGQIGRAFAAVSARAEPDAPLLFLRAELSRRRGEREAAEKDAHAALAHAEATDATKSDARALLARLTWDGGDYVAAERMLGDARGAAAAEVRALVEYARGDFDAGLRLASDAAREADDALATARLDGVRGMLEHARGDAVASLEAFTSAAELAARGGATVEEATYLTGLAAAAIDAGAIARGLSAATRAALLWERLARPALAARAYLSRAAAYALVGATHLADGAAALAIERAQEGRDARAEAYARWAIVETRAPGDPIAAREARAADILLESDDDRIRAAARLLVWGDGVTSAEAIDVRVAARSPTTRWEWWGARATSLLKRQTGVATQALAELVALLPRSAPLGSRGPALAAAARLAAEVGDGDLARRFETARRAAADTLRAGCPPEHLASLASIPWATTQVGEARPGPLGAAQVEQLDAIVRSLASRERLKPLLEQVLDTMVLWTGVERGLLLLRAPDGKLAPRVARNLARRDLHGEQLSLSMTLAMRAMETRAPVLATDAFAQVGDLHASVHALRLRSVLAVPLVARGDVLGVVYLDDRVRRGAFGEAELAWVRLVASQAALAIADARDQALLRRAVRHAERAKERLAAELGERETELMVARAELARGEGTRFAYDEIEGRSEPMQAMLRVVDRVTASDVPVMLFGESGTGKELVARAIHRNGARRKQAFVSENCASVPETLLESTLFGHMRGSFTGASATRIGLFDVANGGTLFLDEIGEMPLSMQTKLLRVLQDGEVRPVGSERVHRVDVRIIGATNRDLEAMVAAGTFREDLFYRLNVVSVRVPPLRERTADIPLLVAHFTDKHAAGRKVKVTRAALDRLVAYPWPGNVRQLENEIRRAIVLADERIDVAELSDDVVHGGPAAVQKLGLGLKDRVEALEAQLIREALDRAKGNQSRAAAALGLSRFGLQKMLRRLNL